MSETPPTRAPDAVLAAEYALGLLDTEDRISADERMLSDRRFAADVETWRLQLAAFALDVAPQAPPEGLWPRVARRLDSTGSVRELRLKRSVTVWRAATAAAAAVAVVLASAIVWPRPPSTTPPLLTARLSASNKGPAVFVAFYEPGKHAIVLTPASVTASADHSPELWLIPTGGKPISLGVAAFGNSVRLIQTSDVEDVGQGTLAVSVEPKGGSPTGQPTGPVIATGQLTRL